MKFITRYFAFFLFLVSGCGQSEAPPIPTPTAASRPFAPQLIPPTSAPPSPTPTFTPEEQSQVDYMANCTETIRKLGAAIGIGTARTVAEVVERRATLDQIEADYWSVPTPTRFTKLDSLMKESIAQFRMSLQYAEIIAKSQDTTLGDKMIECDRNGTAIMGQVEKELDSIKAGRS